MLIATEGGGLKSKAFTLIELLAVIIIIAVIALIATPIIIGVIKKTERQAFERSLDGILEAVRIDYGIDGFEVPRKYFYKMSDLTLIEKGEELQNKNVGMKGKIDGKGFIYVDGDGIRIENLCNKDYCANGKEDNIIITPNETGEVPEYELTDPTITLKGESTIYVGLKETYIEQGAEAKTIGGQVLEYTKEIRVNGEVVSNIDTNIENTYEITYKAENEEKEAVVTRTVIVVDMKPVITITEGSTKYVREQDVLITVNAVRPNTLTNFTVEIKKDGEVISTETVNEISKILTLSETGDYEIKVTATDNNHHTNTVTRTYKIDREVPEITFTRNITLKANEVSGFNLTEDETVVVTDNTNTATWEVVGELNTTVGEQKVTYIARDEAGNETSVERTFEITDSDGPVINYSSASSNNIWIGEQEITLYARIEIDNDELTSFTYQVDNGTEVSVPITDNQQTDTTVTLNTTGKHSIKIKAVGKYGNEKSETIGEFWIDVTAPVVGNIGGNRDTWERSKTLTSTLTDSDSKIKYYALIKDSATKPALDSTDWVSVTETTSYSFSKTIIENGTYYLWAKDSVGNISDPKSVVVNKIDRDNPTAPTTMNFVYWDWKVYTDNTWTNQQYVHAARAQNSPGPTGSTDGNGSGVAKYQISMDSKTWEDYNYVSSETDSMYSMVSEGIHTRYFRAVDYAGNVSESISRTARIDKTKPTAGTAKCNGGTCGSGWYTSDITVTYVNGSDALSGHKSTTVSPTKISSNTSSGAITVTTTDNAGNVQTRTYTVKLDKQAPTITNGSSGVTSITEKTNSAIPGSYFSITNPTTYSGAGTTTCIDMSNGNKVVTNTNSLTVGTHNIRCTVTRGNGLSAYLDRTFTIKSAIKAPTEILTNANAGTNGIIKTDTSGNKRYAGSNPNNYVCFGTDAISCSEKQLWRIIGIVDGNLKLINTQYYSTGIAYEDTDRYNSRWTKPASLNTIFHNNVYNSTIWINSATQKSWLLNNRWRLSDINGDCLESFETAEKESSFTTSKYVGLMTATDYIYASSDNGCGYSSNVVISGDSFACSESNWLKPTISSEWLMNRVANRDSSTVWVVWQSNGGLGNATSDKTWSGARPVVILDSSVKIKSGTGTSGDPYILTK